MSDIIDVLRSVCEMEHWTRRPYSGASGKDLAHPPLITWRYAEPSNELAELFRLAVSTFPGTLAWDFLVTGRNWALLPARVREYAESRGYHGQLQALEELEATDSEFGKLANSELGLLAKHIEDFLPLHGQKTS